MNLIQIFRLSFCMYYQSTSFLYYIICSSIYSTLMQPEQQLPNIITSPHPSDPLAKTLSHILIYSSFYYPCSKPFLLKVVNTVKATQPKVINAAVTHLYSCLEREVITGPSSSFLPPAQLPATHHLDSTVLLPECHEGDLEELTSSINFLGLGSFFEEGDIDELAWYSCSRFLSLKNVHQYREGLKQYEGQLELEGESWLQATPLPGLFCTLRLVLQTVLGDELGGELECSLRLVLARLCFLHNKCLKHPVRRLSEAILAGYGRVLELRREVGISREEYIQLLLEFAFALLFYYKYGRAEAILRHCCALLHMKIEFTGKMGRRTKYQQFDTPQLVMNITSLQESQPEPAHEEDLEGSNALEFIDPKELLARQKKDSPFLAEPQIKASTYDQESILLEAPKFVEGEGEGKGEEVGEHHLLVTLAILYFQWRSFPHDEMQYQNISAAVLRLLQSKCQTSFSYSFSLLLLRSLNEFGRVKHAERALEQFESLRGAFNGKGEKEVGNLYSTPYETHLGYVLVLADKYLEIGLSLTAVDLFQQVGLFEECVDVLIQKDFKEKALEMLERLLEEGRSPRRLCMLGDIHKGETKYYEEAWELSGQRSSRAMRSLGWIYYYRRQFAKAAECFSHATRVSYYHPATWFTLGCCLMNCQQYDRALKAFVECVSIDETQGEAWGNMASCYMQEKKMREAFSSLEQAVRHCERSWMLWANLIKVSLLLKKFYRYFEAIERVVKLQHQEVLTEEVMQKVVQVMRFKNDSEERRRVVFSYRNRIDRLYHYLEQHIGANPLVWKSRCQYQIEILRYLHDMHAHYHHLHSTNALDPSDLVPGYETLESAVLTTEGELARTRARIVEYKQCELNMTMKVGWQQNKTESQQVRRVLLEYVSTYREYSAREDREDFKLFVRGIAQKVAHCLEEEVALELGWAE